MARQTLHKKWEDGSSESPDAESSNEDVHVTWKKGPVSVPQFQHNPFTAKNSGPRCSGRFQQNKLGFFHLFFTNDLLTEIIAETNICSGKVQHCHTSAVFHLV